MTKAIVFAGPSLPPKARSADPLFEFRPPVRQGDVYRAALERPAAIGIIDGYFEVTPTVWHKEILWAMAEGIPVYGAASIGALRAAELDSFGMIGVGWVYEQFRDGILEDDDEVAVLHGPEELGYPPLTEAMVNIRATLAAAVSVGVIAPAPATALIRVAKRAFYMDRCYEMLVRGAVSSGLPAAALPRFIDWLGSGKTDQKRQDAAAMIAMIGEGVAGACARFDVAYRLAETAAWRAARRNSKLPNAS